MTAISFTGRQGNNYDLLRLLAAWLVLFSHCYPISGSAMADPFARTVGIDTLGGIGVAIFFVVSGYLVSQSRERSSSLREFVFKRVTRIFPALIVVSSVCAFLLGPWFTTLALADYFYSTQTYQYLKNATAWSIQYPLPGVFVGHPAGQSVNGSLWSLPYEIRCYVALVLLWWLPLPRRWVCAVLVIALLSLLCLRPTVPPASPFDRFFGLDYYTTKLGLYFAVGAAFFLWREYWKPSLFSGAALIVVALYWLTGNPQTAVFVIGLSTATLAVGQSLSWLPKLPEKMGDWSYGLYLYGFPVQQALFALGVVSLGFEFYVVACTLTALACAGASWYLVEKPAMALRRSLGNA